MRSTYLFNIYICFVLWGSFCVNSSLILTTLPYNSNPAIQGGWKINLFIHVSSLKIKPIGILAPMKYLLSQVINKILLSLTLITLPALYLRLSCSIVCTEVSNWRCYGILTGLNCKSPRSRSVVTVSFFNSNYPVFLTIDELKLLTPWSWENGCVDSPRSTSCSLK